MELGRGDQSPIYQKKRLVQIEGESNLSLRQIALKITSIPFFYDQKVSLSKIHLFWLRKNCEAK
jgi:hypothetical protein